MELQEIQQLLLCLCAAPGTSGAEEAAAQLVQEEWERLFPGETVERDCLGNVTAFLGNRDASRQVLLDAHLDQIGLIVTGVDEHGFLRIAPCGGVDRRVLPGSAVQVFGKQVCRGIVCCLPPHLVKGDGEKVVPVDEMYLDVGMTAEEAGNLIAPGDRAVLEVTPRPLLGGRVTAAGLDNRAGVAALLRCAQLLANETLDCGVTFLFSSREETGCEGAKTASYHCAPTEAVVVDVSFATQPGVSPEKSGKLSGGVMIGTAPSLDRALTQRMVQLAKEQDIPMQMEVMGGRTGTNADEIGVSRAGVRTALLSIPLRYMHTTAELIDSADAEHTARLLAAYVTKGAGENGRY